MIVNLRLLFSMLLIMAAISARAAINFTINRPTPASVVSKDLTISVSISSTYSIDVVKATVGNKETLLLRPINADSYIGTIDLTGLSQGTLQLNVQVKDAMGNIETKTQNFTYDLLPTITVISPAKNESFRQSKIHIKATATDPGSATCKGRVEYGNLEFNFVNSIDTIVDLLPAGLSSSGRIRFSAIDALSQTARAFVQIYIDKSQYLKPFFSHAGDIIDFKGDRALVLERDNGGIPHLKIVNVATNATEEIDMGPNVVSNTFVQGILCANGAALALTYKKTALETDSVYVWKNGTLTNIVNRPGVAQTDRIQSEGNYLMVHRDDLSLTINDLTNLNELFSTQALDATGYLSKQGVLVYSKIVPGPRFNVEKYNIATNTITAVATGGYNTYPIIDGNNIVYTHYDQYKAPFAIHLNNGTTDKVIASVDNNANKYVLNDGYVVYAKPDNSKVEQWWLKTPAGVDRQLTFFSTPIYITMLGNEGRTMFSYNEHTLYTDSITPLKPVSGTYNPSFFRLVNNNFYLLLGNNIFRYDIPSGPPAVVTAISPTSAGKGQTVTITGERFTGATGVTFGNVQASSYTVVSDTKITAVVDAGESGTVTVQYPAGNGSISGFTYLPPPKITSLSAMVGNGLKLITINGDGFTGTTAVSFGGVPAKSFSVTSSKTIAARVGEGASGAVKVTNPFGEATFAGFKYLPVPAISANGTAILAGGNIILTASPNTAEYTYQWYRNGAAITGATATTYSATVAGSYTVRLTISGTTTQSEPVEITQAFSLPASNYKITNTSVTCRGANNGNINITATANLNYTATITGDNMTASYNFPAALNIKDLAAGTYNVCITLASVPGYSQCFTSVITQPADLSVYTSVIKADNNVVLSLAGGDIYYISLNGKTTETRAGQVTLALKPGNNTISVNTDKACQGTVTKSINIEDFRAPYPNPFAEAVNIDLGDDLVKNAAIRVYNSSSSKEVFNQKYTDRSGKVNISLKDLAAGVYIVRLTVDNKETVYKVIKM